MSTPYVAVYTQFLADVDLYSLANLDDITLEANLEAWLNKAVSYYPNPRVDLNDRDATLKCFNIEINPIEIEALAKFMLMAYMLPHLVSDQYMEQNLNSKDYRIYSTANQIKALRELRGDIKREAYSLVSKNSYSIASINKFTDKGK